MKQMPKRKLIPLLTDFLEYKQAAHQTIPYAKKMQQTYGDVCDVSFTGIKNYFIHDPELIKELLTTHGPEMQRTYFFKAFRKLLGMGLFTADGLYHKQQRKLIKPAFYPQRIAAYADTMVACAEAEMKKWKEGEWVNINQAMTRVTMKVITKALFGTGLSDELIDDVGHYVSELINLINRVLSNPFYTYCLIHEIPIPPVNRFFKLKVQLDKVVNDVIANYRKQDLSSSTDLLSMLMELKDEETNAQMNDQQIRDEVMTFILAGHETTTLALTWSFYLLGKNPEIADKWYAEVDQVIKGETPGVAHYIDLVYTKNIVKEALRLYPPAWTFSRSPKEDIVINDYFFPKGCTLWTITYLLHHDERYFSEPEKFIPERWEEEAMKQIPKYAYIPFGGGNRLCIGEGFAWMETVLVLATAAKQFRFELDLNFSTSIHPIFSLRTKEPVLMKVKKREGKGT